MIADIDVYRSAAVLIREYGDEAPIHAAMRADAMAKSGDLEGYRVWRRILKAVDDLLPKDAPHEIASH